LGSALEYAATLSLNEAECISQNFDADVQFAPLNFDSLNSQFNTHTSLMVGLMSHTKDISATSSAA
jgi:hypothetical protein